MPHQDTGPAREAFMQNAAERAAADPAKLARSVRVVRAALDLARTDPKIRAAIAEAPPLSAEQISELRGLLAPAPEGRTAA